MINLLSLKILDLDEQHLLSSFVETEGGIIRRKLWSILQHVDKLIQEIIVYKGIIFDINNLIMS